MRERGRENTLKRSLKRREIKPLMGIYNNTDSRTPKRKKQIKGGFMKGREISRKVGTNKGA